MRTRSVYGYTGFSGSGAAMPLKASIRVCKFAAARGFLRRWPPVFPAEGGCRLQQGLSAWRKVVMNYTGWTMMQTDYRTGKTQPTVGRSVGGGLRAGIRRAEIGQSDDARPRALAAVQQSATQYAAP
ncbi:hypothetical protein KCP78_01590 [Salmonella enterica subsp. enterica]|nr:hypothetical protein KCP78_01590 [Salmonella enterica subsp. enterica]